MVRIDHFRAFHTYWSIPAGAKSAKEGHWEPGPGLELLQLLQTASPKLELIAEDLGDLDQDALHFVRTCGIPGMKVMVFAFDPQGESAYLPHNCQPFSVVYTGTHDTPTFVQWLFEQAAPAERDYAFDYLRLREDEGLGWGSLPEPGPRAAIWPWLPSRMCSAWGLTPDEHPRHLRRPQLVLAGTYGRLQPLRLR